MCLTSLGALRGLCVRACDGGSTSGWAPREAESLRCAKVKYSEKKEQERGVHLRAKNPQRCQVVFGSAHRPDLMIVRRHL